MTTMEDDVCELTRSFDRAAKREERRKQIGIVEAWGERKGIDVRELVFRMRTASLEVVA